VFCQKYFYQIPKLLQAKRREAETKRKEERITIFVSETRGISDVTNQKWGYSTEQVDFTNNTGDVTFKHWISSNKRIESSGWSKTLRNCKGFWVWCISKHLYRSFRTSSSEVWWAGGSRTDRDVFIDLHWQLNQKWGWLLIMRIPAIWFALLYIFLSWNN